MSLARHLSIRPFRSCLYVWPLCANMTSSTKPEVHNVSQRCHRKIGPRSQATCNKNLVKFGHPVFKICSIWPTDKQTQRSTSTLTTILYTHIRGEVVTLKIQSIQRGWMDHFQVGHMAQLKRSPVNHVGIFIIRWISTNIIANESKWTAQVKTSNVHVYDWLFCQWHC